MDRAGSSRRLPAAVVLLGVVSLLTDASSEMIFPLLPAFLAARIPHAPVLLGAMEGLADLIAAGAKWWSGRWADRARRLKPMILFGYSLAAVMRPLMAFATHWWQPLTIRSIDRIGKGLRGTPRDALIAEAVPAGGRGRAFGYQRGMDHAGAALGSVLAIILVAAGLEAENIFLLSVVPGVLAVVALLFVREPPRQVAPDVLLAPTAAKRALEPMPRRLWAYFVPVTMFGLGNATDAFLLLKLTEQGASPALAPVAWLLLHAVKSAVSFPAGRLADRLGNARVVMAGWAMYALSYVALAFSPNWMITLVVIAFYGLYHAFAEGAERALLADLSPDASRGRAFGTYYALAGVSALGGGILFGVLWERVSSRGAFLTAGVLALLSLVLLRMLLPKASGATPAAA